MRIVYIFLINLTFLITSQAETLEGKVVSVVDGNTFEILTKDKEKVKVMLYDVDSPELDQPHGKEAKVFVEKLLLKKKVKVELKGKDRWGNKLAGIQLKNGSDLSTELVKSGFAWVGERYQKLGQLKGFENSAKDKKIGMWQNQEIVSPWVYRRKQTMLRAKGR